MTERYASAPRPTYRLVPSQFPPIGLFDTVSTPADLQQAMELAGWTNDRLVYERIKRLPQNQWAYGRPNASIIMASFLHASPTRFNGDDIGAWYSAASIKGSIVEVAQHLRREAVARSEATMTRTYRTYVATLTGSDYRDIRGDKATMPEVYAERDYVKSQAFGADVRAAGKLGIVYDSLRLVGGVNTVAFRPDHVINVLQGDHFEITVEAASQILTVTKLAA